jgi:hypothetical protein
MDTAARPPSRAIRIRRKRGANARAMGLARRAKLEDALRGREHESLGRRDRLNGNPEPVEQRVEARARWGRHRKTGRLGRIGRHGIARVEGPARRPGRARRGRSIPWPEAGREFRAA